MSIKIREDTEMRGISLGNPTKRVLSFSHKERQQDNEDEMLSLFSDDSQTTTTSTEQIKAARESIFTYKISSCSE